MGISSIEGLALLSLAQGGQIGDEILCLGRPELFMTHRQVKKLVHGLGLSWNDEEIASVVKSRFGEPFLQRAGFRTIRTLDASSYEGAEIIHDLNEPIPQEFEGTTRFLFANGTIEHVFNIAVALQNVTRLLRTDGTLLVTAPANGQCGHGFYQFSPEFFYRYLEVNGFERIRIYVVGRKHPQRWFYAKDPREMKRRIEFMTMEPTEIVVIAHKARAVSQFVTPQQSDYAQILWNSNDPRPESWSPRARTLSSIVHNKVQFPLAIALRYVAGIGMPVLNRHPFFEPVDPFSKAL